MEPSMPMKKLYFFGVIVKGSFKNCSLKGSLGNPK